MTLERWKRLRYFFFFLGVTRNEVEIIFLVQIIRS